MSTQSIGQPIDNAEYHAMPGVSNSKLSDFIADPRLYWYKHLSGQYVSELKPYFDIGTAVHDALLGGPRFVAIPPDVLTSNGQRRGKKWDAFTADNAGSVLLLPKDAAIVNGCVEAIRRHAMANTLLQRAGVCEQMHQYEDSDLKMTLRCKPDKLCQSSLRNLVLDIKTTSGSTLEFAKSAANFGYHRQQYFYEKVLARCGIEVHEFVFIAVSTTPPHTVDCYVLDDEFRGIAAIEVEDALVRLSDMTHEDSWHTEPTYVRVLSPPKWLKYKEI